MEKSILEIKFNVEEVLVEELTVEESAIKKFDTKEPSVEVEPVVQTDVA